jgi:hypothetical protein
VQLRLLVNRQAFFFFLQIAPNLSTHCELTSPRTVMPVTALRVLAELKSERIKNRDCVGILQNSGEASAFGFEIFSRPSDSFSS